ADKHGRPYYMVIGIMLAGGGMSLTGLLDNFYGLCAAVMISGVGIAMFHPQAAQLVNKYSDPQSKGAKMGLFSFGGNLGFTVGPILASAAITAFGLRGTLIFLLPPLLFGLIATLTFRNDTETATAQVQAAAVSQQPENWSAFGRLSLLIVSRSIMYNGINTFLVLYLVETFAIPKPLGNTFLSCYYAVTAFSALFGGKLADKYGHRKILRLSFAIYLPAIALFALSFASAAAAGRWHWPLLQPHGAVRPALPAPTYRLCLRCNAGAGGQHRRHCFAAARQNRRYLWTG
ncbi:MAG: MFS transporter, partial [Firmicutes bacterium]|nr:MFS transporter [Bacillota bacterium]